MSVCRQCICNLINTLMKIIFSIQSTVIASTISHVCRWKKNKITSDCISFSPSFYFSPLVSHCHIRMRGALVEKRVWKNLSHRWNIIMYNSCHCLVLSTNMISMKIYYCHVLPLRARSNRNVISLICSTNEFSRCVFMCAYLFVSFIFDLISFFNETLCPNSNLPNNHMLTFSYLVYIA